MHKTVLQTLAAVVVAEILEQMDILQQEQVMVAQELLLLDILSLR
jgi:hypothetical protein